MTPPTSPTIRAFRLPQASSAIHAHQVVIHPLFSHPEYHSHPRLANLYSSSKAHPTPLHPQHSEALPGPRHTARPLPYSGEGVTKAKGRGKTYEEEPHWPGRGLQALDGVSPALLSSEGGGAGAATSGQVLRTYKSALTTPFPSVSNTLKACSMVSSGSVPRGST